MPPATTWTDVLEKQFLLEIIERGGANANTYKDIATKWGPPHTQGSLGMKYNRLKNALHKQEGNGNEDNETGTPRKGGKDAGTPSKAGKGGRKRKEMSEDGDSDKEVMEKKSKVKKHDEVKLEDFADSGAEV